jgi:hypothetical protein
MPLTYVNLCAALVCVTLAWFFFRAIRNADRQLPVCCYLYSIDPVYLKLPKEKKSCVVRRVVPIACTSPSP